MPPHFSIFRLKSEFSRMADTLERPGERNRRIEVGGPDVLSFREIAQLAARAAGVRNLRRTNAQLYLHILAATCTGMLLLVVLQYPVNLVLR
jgi:uncharacterized protein YbjT (DUF2867 family)